MSGSRSTATMRRGGGDAPASAAVSVPSPAPSSTTTSSAPAPAAATMRASTLRSWRKFCPHDFFAAMPWRASTRRGSSNVPRSAGVRAASPDRPSDPDRRARRADTAASQPPRSSPRCRCSTSAAECGARSRPRFAASASAARSPRLAATPPHTTSAPNPSRASARRDLRTSTSTIAAWKLAQKFASSPSTNADAGRAASNVAAAVLSPEKLKSRSSRPASARGSVTARASPVAASLSMTTPPG